MPTPLGLIDDCCAIGHHALERALHAVTPTPKRWCSCMISRYKPHPQYFRALIMQLGKTLLPNIDYSQLTLLFVFLSNILCGMENTSGLRCRHPDSARRRR